MKRRLVIPGAALVAALVLTAGSCQEYPSQDRSDEAGGRTADDYADTSQVTVWRNVDNVPNIVTFCADNQMFWATLSVDGQRAPAVGILPDRECGR